MSDIYGKGYGSAHDWQYCWSSWKTSVYQCARCGHKFAHAYDCIPDIFEAMKRQSVPAECRPTCAKSSVEVVQECFNATTG